MIEEDLEVAIKVVVVGNGAVGKSSMIRRYCKGVYTQDYKKTIGVDFLEREIEVDDDNVRLMVWDTAGQEEFDSITKAYYRGAQVCVLAFSTTDKDSFDAIERWKNKVEAECGAIVMVVVQNKIDLIDESAVSAEDVEALTKRLKLHLFRTSVKENFNIDEVFLYLSRKFLSQQRKEATERAQNQQPTSSLAQIFTSSIDNLDKAGHKDNANGKLKTNEEKSFKIKPTKERVQRKHRPFCALL
ncbi:PREDICTED: ras-related protein Rab-23-like [Amphimedon queenslandica]|uniref:Ras-related protein Rab-23 n=1 Tax=Amphimedon queenslandica TaxID=400682 RepID=A0A1X7TN75_AMPQE|nr:PREDICTED: ras-related protein Rab-23-like [Amphimedon queenslandica]|eukprot:XP_003390188.1 PREDICTED: ras-related protein Rab-23-like [Amphimedon queenslandica]